MKNGIKLLFFFSLHHTNIFQKEMKRKSSQRLEYQHPIFLQTIYLQQFQLYQMIEQTLKEAENQQVLVEIQFFKYQYQNSLPEIKKVVKQKNQQNLKQNYKTILPEIESQIIIYQNQNCFGIMDKMQKQSDSLINQSDSQSDQNNLTIKYSNRSSNNSYKKYTSAAKKNLFKLISSSKKNTFIQQNKQYKSSRVYFFCFLIYAFTHLSLKQIKKFIKGFVKDVKKKIFQYEDQATNTKNKALQKFRLSEIQDIKLSLISLKLFSTRSIEEGIQVVYKKNRGQISKLSEYKRTVATIKQLAQKASIDIKSLNLGEVIDSEINRKIKDRILVLNQIPPLIQINEAVQQKQIKQPVIMQVQPIQRFQMKEEKNWSNIQKLKQIQNKRTKQEESQEDEPINSFNLIQGHTMTSFPFMPGSNFMNFSFGMNPIGFNIFTNQPFKFDQVKEEENQIKKKEE